MSSMGFEGLTNMLSGIAADTANQDIKMINIAELHNSPDNFFAVENIDELAEAILEQGRVKENLIVTPIETGGYEIVSGHRRKAAVQSLLDKGENVSEMLPCLVLNYADDASKMIDLIMMNITQRKLSDADLYTSFTELNKIFQEQKEKGMKLGKLREKIAKSLDVSPAQIGKLQNIESHAVQELKDAIKDGNVSISAADKIAKLDEEEQINIINNTDTKQLTRTNVKSKVDEISIEEDEEAESFEVVKEDETPSAEMIYEQEVDTGINFSEIKDFVSEHRETLERVLDDLAGMVDTEDEQKIVRQFASIIARI